MRVLRILRLAKIHEYQRMLKLPTNIIFYHFKHSKKRYSVPKLHSNYKAYRHSTTLQITVA